MKSPTGIIKKTVAQITIQAPKEAVFNLISDHEGVPNWISDVQKVTLTKVGQPKNGVGAVRQVVFKPKLWSDLSEAITAYTENEGFQYKILSGMPGLIDHLGTWKLEDGGTLVTWDIHFEFKKFHWFRLILGSFIKSFSQVQKDALSSLKTKLS